MSTWDRTRDAVEDKVDEATKSEHPRRYASSDEPDLSVEELVAETRREVGGVVTGPGVPAMTQPMWRGLLVGSILGGIIGAVLLLPLAFVEMAGVPLWGRMLIVGAIGAVGGGTAGAHYWGGRVPELSGESLDADNTPSVGSTLADPNTDERGR